MFTETKVYCFDPDFLTIEWEFDDARLGYIMSLYRSQSPEGPWVLLSDELANRNIYHDWEVNLNSFHNVHYYKLVYHDEEGDVESDSIFLANAPDAIAVDIARRMSLVLDLYNGNPVFFYLRRSWGPRCPNCWDQVTRKQTMSNCPVCYDTGYAGGFFDPIQGYVTNFNPTKELQFKQLYEKEPEIYTFWTNNYPLLKPRDIFVDNMNNRWVIKVVQTTQKMGSILRQNFSAVRVNKKDIIYKIDVPNFGEFNPIRNYHVWSFKEPDLPE